MSFIVMEKENSLWKFMKRQRKGYEQLLREKGNKLTLTPFPESGVETLTYEQAVDYLSKMIEELKQDEKS